MTARTQADRIFTAAVAPSARAVPRVVAVRDAAPAKRGAPAWALVRDAAGGLFVLGSWAALWTWFLAATW